MKRYAHSSAAPTTSGHLRAWGLGLALIGLLLLVGIHRFRSSLPNRIHTEVLNELQRQLKPMGLSAALRAVEFVEGKGFRINDLRIEHQSSTRHGKGSPLMEIYEGFIHAPVGIGQLVTGNISPKTIVVRGAKLTLIKNRQGQWEVDPILQHLQNNQNNGFPELAVRLRESEIKIIDRSHSPPCEGTFREINLDIQPMTYQNRRLLQFTGSFSGLALSLVKVRAYLDPQRKTWYTDIEADEAQLSRDLFKFLPESLSKSVAEVQVLDGKVMLRGAANGDLAGVHPVRFKVAGQIRDLSVDDRRMPLPLRNGSIDFSIDHEKLKISRATGQLGEGSFDLAYSQPDLYSRSRWTLAGRLDQVEFTDQLHRWMPSNFQKFCRDFQPRGRANIEFKLEQNGSQLSRNISSQLIDMSFNYYKFPYLLQNCIGKIGLINDDCEFEVVSTEGAKRIRFDGRSHRPGKPDSTYVVNVSAEGKFPIDDRLIGGLGPFPQVKKQILAFRPMGHVNGRGSFIKSRPDQFRPNKNLDIQLLSCNVRHQSFEYPVGDVNGIVKVRDDRCEFENVTGVNGSTGVRCDGSWSKSSGLDLRFYCNQVPLDDKCRLALTSNLREIWDGFRPRGTVGLLRVDVRLAPGQKHCDVALDADLAAASITDENGSSISKSTSSVSIFPTWFPYEISQLSGKVKIGSGRIELRDMKGRHRRTWMACNANGEYTQQGCSVALNDLLVGSLPVDEELLSAFPSSVSTGIEALDYQGLLNLRGKISVVIQSSHTASPGQPLLQQVKSRNPKPINRTLNSQLYWDLRLDMNQAQMQIGLPVKNIFGMVRLQGEYAGNRSRCLGELAIDSMTVHEAQVTNVRGPIWIDEAGVAFGTLAAQESQQSQRRQLTGELFGGQIKLDGQKLVEDNGRFFVQASLEDGRLKEIVNEFAPHMTQIDGRSHAGFRLTGDDSGTHTYRGEGSVQLRDADIYELPIVLSLFKILRIKEVNRTAFDSSDIDFAINGTSIDLDRIELIGDAFSLIGNGKIKFNQQIDLNFYSVMGRNRYIPLLTEIYKAGSQRILWINVDGTLNNPQMHRHVLPQLNDTIRSLLQPVQPTVDRSNARVSDLNLASPVEENLSITRGNDTEIE